MKVIGIFFGEQGSTGFRRFLSPFERYEGNTGKRNVFPVSRDITYPVKIQRRQGILFRFSPVPLSCQILQVDFIADIVRSCQSVFIQVLIEQPEIIGTEYHAGSLRPGFQTQPGLQDKHPSGLCADMETGGRDPLRPFPGTVPFLLICGKGKQTGFKAGIRAGAVLPGIPNLYRYGIFRTGLQLLPGIFYSPGFPCFQPSRIPDHFFLCCRHPLFYNNPAGSLPHVLFIR